jgi:asparagine N-glycosylation enzyme membrane subunit Stt3
MIQRLQTVLFLVAAAINFSILFSRMGFSNNNETNLSYEIFGTYCIYTDKNPDKPNGRDVFEMTEIPFYKTPFQLVNVVATIAVSGLLFFLIFQFKNRPFQIRLAYIALGLTFVQILFSVLLSQQIEHQILPNGIEDEFSGQSQVQFGFYMPIAVVLITFWGIMRVKKDELLVKESSRLR